MRFPPLGGAAPRSLSCESENAILLVLEDQLDAAHCSWVEEAFVLLFQNPADTFTLQKLLMPRAGSGVPEPLPGTEARNNIGIVEIVHEVGHTELMSIQRRGPRIHIRKVGNFFTIVRKLVGHRYRVVHGDMQKCFDCCRIDHFRSCHKLSVIRADTHDYRGNKCKPSSTNSDPRYTLPKTDRKSTR